jgi:hypothetical protein
MSGVVSHHNHFIANYLGIIDYYLSRESLKVGIVLH